ncbi:hypothetical protein VPNG_03522 [Cytospora leucostoma]|uniref:Uncharacterized protein n=1 Tax=Cytospora leucostoma TaxID=1230097 RepID=A0A423XCJ5_9PEZI|nr:hypothetical protein VPNG_03522 [Cytospora leucostoma]
MTDSTSILSILCDDRWRVDSAEECMMLFYRDGTGEMIIRHEMHAWVAAQTEWKCLDGAAVLDRKATVAQDDSSQASKGVGGQIDFIADLSLEIIITKRAITSRGPTEGLYLNDFYLKDEVFNIPKRYSARLERGTFITTMEAKLNSLPPWAPRFKYRLSFDKSPYPEAEHWFEDDEDEDGHYRLLPRPYLPFSEWKELCSGMIKGELA